MKKSFKAMAGKGGGRGGSKFNFHNDKYGGVAYERDETIESDSETEPADDDRKVAIEKIVEREIQNRCEEGMGGAKEFCYYGFQQCLRAKQLIMELDRLVKLLRGETPDLPQELTNYGKELQRMYGKLDETNGMYARLYASFKISRLEVIVTMMETENRVIKWMLQKKFSDALECTSALEDLRKTLKLEMERMDEVAVDVNPFTSPLRMDFFTLPRPEHKVSIYDVGSGNGLDEESNVFRREGYNAAVLDVGHRYAHYCCPDVEKYEFFSKDPERKTVHPHALRISKEWSVHLSRMNKSMMDFKLGVEINKFVISCRERAQFSKDQTLFGVFGDGQGVSKISEIFYVTKLGYVTDRKMQRKEILFHSLLEGMIVPPEEILRRVWKRILFFLKREAAIRLSSVPELYKNYYGEEMPMTNWGFENMSEFVHFSKNILAAELQDIDVESLTDEEIADQCNEASLRMKTKKCIDSSSDTKTSTKASMSTDEGPSRNGWVKMREPLPKGTVFRIVSRKDPKPLNFLQS